MRVYIVAASDSEPDEERRLRWGDYWFKDSLGRAVERLGHELVEDIAAAEVLIHLHGYGIERVPDWTYNILWVHSHPAAAERLDMRRYDRAFAESAEFAEHMGIEHLPGASDMKPLERAIEHEAVFVGNGKRGGRRPSVDKWLAEHPDGAGLAVWGENWTGLPDGVWRGLYYPHEKLGELYASTRHVLNDNHADMDEWHFTNPRLYDVAALKGERVPTFDDVARTMLDGVRWQTRVELGCGKVKRPGFVGLDWDPDSDADIVADVRDPLPWADGEVDYIVADNLMEHIGAPFGRVMNECWRVLRPGGRMQVIVPRAPHPAAFQDPEHVRFFTPETFDYLDGKHRRWKLYGSSYGYKPWELIHREIVDDWRIEASLRRPSDG
jgi:hypothetical protein